ncbi:triose-phosphate isomerase [Alloacidobacterium dinghuense]|uniref:Triosephosphate isomerase n=1 Tax=Alloacidobacterium dinghuense TaxID=2763107 RepID=A0A7G8BMC6_9BACT|nr:triose-phosphate isomerase [Alloacidobacterium dinghuense]QNI33696.1 triose-phosphate isomerase [Alloacidobacterium dinghuense]
MRKPPLIAANWKMYKTPAQAEGYVKTFLPLVAGHDRDEIVLCPSDTSICAIVPTVAGSNVAIGGQNMHFAEEGAYTGETSALMLKAIGATHVIIGHSERRQYFNETDESVNKKLATALKHQLIPIVCIGEVLAEREDGHTDEVLRKQISLALVGVTPEDAENIVVAYEPVWAIGTGKTATPEIAATAHLLIRSEIARRLGRHVADTVRILYGGSVKPDNATALLNQPEIDGALVGGASLDPQSFAKIVKY